MDEFSAGGILVAILLEAKMVVCTTMGFPSCGYFNFVKFVPDLSKIYLLILCLISHGHVQRNILVHTHISIPILSIATIT